jgi:hypothetical protein
MVGFKTIDEMTIDERYEILAAVAGSLDESAREAAMEGHNAYAENSRSLAATINGSVEELASEELHAANVLLQQAMSMLSAFRNAHPHRAQSLSIH